LVQDRGGAEFQTAGILLYVEDLKRGTNKDIEPKDIFEMGSKKYRYPINVDSKMLKGGIKFSDAFLLDTGAEFYLSISDKANRLIVGLEKD
jgi:hypothetical protein